MELNYHDILLKISNLTTVSSYIKGTIIFTLFTITEDANNDLVMLGFFFVLLAVLVNVMVFGMSLITALWIKDKELKQKYWIAIAFQLANIPIAYAYFYYVMQSGNVNI